MNEPFRVEYGGREREEGQKHPALFLRDRPIHSRRDPF